MEIRKFQGSNDAIEPSESTALVHIGNKRSSSIQNSEYGDEHKSKLLSQSLNIADQSEEISESHKYSFTSYKSHTSHTASHSPMFIDNLKAKRKAERWNNLRECVLNQKIYYLFPILMASITTFLSTLMMFNKLWYKFFDENIWFINSNNFNFLNNIYKLLSIISLLYLWKVCRNNSGVQNGLLQVMCKSKWYSSDRQYFLIMLGFLISYNLAYDIFVKKDKWNDRWTHIMANLFDDIFVCIVIPMVLSIDFNLKKNIKVIIIMEKYGNYILKCM